jgi:SAM-dependent methyltransferase
MKLTRQPICPGCDHRRLSPAYTIFRQPVVLNYRFHDEATAMRVKRRDIRLRQCARCKLIFNSTVDPTLIPYDENYENRQCFSPAFQQHLKSLADMLIARHRLRGKTKRILEVGCGKGDFLRLLCRRAKAQGCGYDTSYEGPTEQKQKGVQFFRKYITAADINTPFDAVICRHVVEHVPQIGKFLVELHSIARACGNPIVVIETPSFEWIANHISFWDIFYEHCNYFSLSSLVWLCRRAGFTVVDQRLAFGGQYQILDLRLARGNHFAPSQPPTIPTQCQLKRFSGRAEMHLIKLENRVARSAKGDWAIWGAGAKGVALVSRLKKNPPRFVIDSNHAKQGCVIPGSRVPVIAPRDKRICKLSLVLIANPNYAAEITSVLRRNHFGGTILTT